MGSQNKTITKKIIGMKKVNFDSDHFTLFELVPGVFAAIHKEGGGAIGNAGIIDLGDKTMVFDTFISPFAAQDLKVAAEKLIAKPVSIVVNSHYHNDHIRGNQVFEETEIISTEVTLELIKTEGREEFAWDNENAPRIFKELSEQGGDPVAIDYYRVIAESLPGLEMVLPTKTFKDRLEIVGSARKVELVSYGGGHTGDDAFLILPDEKIAFLADLLFVQSHPFLADGDPDALCEYLEKIMQLDLEVLVPGHGPVGEMGDVGLLRDYVRAMIDLSEDLVSTGKRMEDISLDLIPAEYRSWLFRNFFRANLTFLYNQKLSVDDK